MPVFTIQAPDGRQIDIDAADQDTAMRGAQEWATSNPKKAPPGPAPVSPPAAKSNAFNDVAGYMSNYYRATGIGDEAAVGLGTAASAIQDVVTGKQSPGNAFLTIGDRYSERLQAERQREDDFAQRHPNLAANAKGLGLSTTMVVPGAPAAEALAAGRAVIMAKGGLTAATTGAAYSLADRGTLEERGKAATETGLNPFLWTLGAAGGAFAPVAPKVAKAPKNVSDDVMFLAKEGVDNMTPGQIRGGWAKVAEDQATSLPILGPAIQEARNATLDTYNRAAINRSLAPIGEKLPEGLNSGYGAVKYAGDKLSAAYKTVLPEGGVVADQEFGQAVRQIAPILDTLTPKSQKQLQQIVNSRVMSRLTNDDQVLSGDMYKQVESELSNAIRRFSSSTDADQRGIGEALTVVKDALSDAAARQNPKFAAAKAKIDAGWANLVPVERAAAMTGAEGGKFSAAQLDNAVKAGSDTVRKRGYGRGDALGQDLATAGRAVLPSKVGDSGSAGRGMMGMVASIPGAVAGAATGGGVGALAGIAATAAGLTGAARMYSESAIAAGNKALQASSTPERAEAMRQLAELAAKSPEAQLIYREVVSKLPRAAGVGAASYQSQRPNALSIGR